MSITAKKTKLRKATSVFLSISTAIWLSGAAMLVPVATHAATIDELQAQIAALLAQIQTLQSQLTTLQGGSAVPSGFTFATNLKMGSTGQDVKNLQIALNSSSDTRVAASGAGSPGNETTFFGSLTKAAVIKFQEKHAADVLTPVGLSSGTGFVGASTRAKLNSLFGGAAPSTPVSGTTPTTPAPTTPAPTTPAPAAPAGTGLTVSAAANQAAATLAPNDAINIPYTKVNFTAGSDGDVTVDSIVVERTGLANDAAFSGVVLLDEQGLQIGLIKTINSVHQATLNTAFKISAGQTRTLTIGANRGNTSSYAGQTGSFSLVTVNTSATVSGSLPIVGTSHTVNETLSIGSITVARGARDPATDDTSQEIGTKNYVYSAVRITAGSNEKIFLKAIKWNQTGSIAKADLANINTYIDGDTTAYPVTVSDDGKYYTSTFPNILIDKGAAKEIYVQADVEGGSGRTVDFDLDKREDLLLVGETYGYYLRPPNGTDTSGTDDGAFHQDTNPWYDAFQTTIANGTMTVSKGVGVAAQNVGVNVSSQPLGGFDVDVKGEGISVGSTVIKFLITSAGGVGTDMDNVALYDANGNIVAGPVDATGASQTATVTFTDTITYKVGKHSYTLKGKLTTNFVNNQTIQGSTTPSTNWTTVTGQITGNTITPSPTSAITFNTMTAKAGVLTIRVAPTPVAQTVVAGGGQVVFANYDLDAAVSGEDIRMTTLPLAYMTVSTKTNLTNCTIYDGATALTTGSNVVNPTSSSASSTSFTIDGSGITVPAGTVKRIALKCDVAGGATGTYQWGIDDAATYSATGLTSGQSITPTAVDSAGQQQTLAANGTLTVTLDSSSPSYKVVAAGETATVAHFRVEGTNEPIAIKTMRFQLTNTASSSSGSLVGGGFKLYEGETLLGTGNFSGSNTIATSTLAAGVLTIPKDGFKIITVKADIAAIGTAQPATQGHLIAIDSDSLGTVGSGSGSGVEITSTGADTASNGVRIFKSYPTVAKQAIPNSDITNTSGKDVYYFSVTANSKGAVHLSKATLRFSSSTASATTSVYRLYGFTDSARSTGVPGYANGLLTPNGFGPGWVGAVNSHTQQGDINFYFRKTSTGATTTVDIPAGSTYYFSARADISGVVAGTGNVLDRIEMKLLGDAAYPTQPLLNFMAQAGLQAGDANGIDLDTNNDFIWSPNATTTSAVGNNDWTNGYFVSGLLNDDSGLIQLLTEPTS